MFRSGILLVGTTLLAQFVSAQTIQPLAFKVQDKAPDVASLLSPSQVRVVDSYLGARIFNNEKNRLLNGVDENVLLAGFRKRPGEQAWVGEHVGKFLHAATLAWVNTGDAELRAKIDRVAAELMKCQLSDGYLGTYIDKDRWTSWDVWVHKYNIIGLLTYYQYTGNQAALECSKRMADLLVNTFGPGKRDIIKSGEHVGMAATSVLEPIVLLYKFTADERYLDFAKYIVASYDQPNGPKIVKTLTEVKRVDKTANGKAYEMMSNLVGLCELYRVTGDKTYLIPALNAWEDIVANHLYITGTVSYGEHFHAPHDLPNNARANVGETCATVTWLQLNAQLLRITGEAKYGEELERTVYNHLTGAQRPDGAQWCYYTPLTGKKPYSPGPTCCASIGPRGMAMVPQLAYQTYKANGAAGLAVNIISPGQASTSLGGQAVTVNVSAEVTHPEPDTLDWDIYYVVDVARPSQFAFKVRCPAWADSFKVAGPEQTIEGKPAHWVEIPARRWKKGDSVTVNFQMRPRLVAGTYSNEGHNALTFGPLVLAFDQKHNPDLPAPAGLALIEKSDSSLSVDIESGRIVRVNAHVRTDPDAQPVVANFIPFAEAGADGSAFQVWMSTTNRPANASLLAPGRESRSRRGNQDGSIIDGELESIVVTFDGKGSDEDWFAVTLGKPVSIKRIVYAHGRSFHDGGWFDASAGKPKIQIQKRQEGEWETVGTLDTYPATTSADNKGLRDGQQFILKLDRPVQAFAVRVIGKPACGDNARQAFSSCAELQAYKD